MKFAQIVLFVCLALSVVNLKAESQPATASVGKVLFALGKTSVTSSQGATVADVSRGQLVYEGDNLRTGINSHLHLQMMDGALLVLRPSSSIRVVNYYVDEVAPANNRILLDMQQGVVRSVTGKGGETNKQGFRLNTPVAAIGIRGTDFTVLASSGLSSVSLRAGGVVVSPFSAECPRYALGACSGGQAVVLTATEAQMLAEIRPSGAARVPKVNATAVPDQVAPAHPVEGKSLQESKVITNQVTAQNDPKTNDKVASTTPPTGTPVKSSSNQVAVVSAEAVKSDAKMSSSSNSTAEVASLAPVTAEIGAKESVTSEIFSRVVADKTADKSVKTVQTAIGVTGVTGGTPLSGVSQSTENVATQAVTTPQPFYWGRWSSDDPAQLIARDATKNRQIFTANQVYLLANTESNTPQLPPNGTVSFKMNAGEAVVMRGNDQTSPASIRNARLDANFDQNRFTTGLTVEADGLPNGAVNLAAEGALQRDTGRFFSSLGSTMSVAGALSDNANHAAYHFSDGMSNVAGVTTWSR